MNQNLKFHLSFAHLIGAAFLLLATSCSTTKPTGLPTPLPNRDGRMEDGYIVYFDGAGGGTAQKNWAEGVKEGILQAGYTGAGEMFSWETGDGLKADQVASVKYKRSKGLGAARHIEKYVASRASTPQNRAVPDPSGDVVWEPSKSSSGPFSILVSYADRRVYVWRNGIQIGQAPITISGSNPPEGVFLLLDGEDPPDGRYPGLKMRPWTALSLDGGDTSGDVVSTLRSQVTLPKDFHKKINRALVPGTILLSTTQSSNASTRSGRDFTIMKPEDK